MLKTTPFVKITKETAPNLIERFANTCCILNKNDEAIELYINLLKKQPNNIVALRQLTDMYENTNAMMYRATKAKLFELEENLEGAEKELLLNNTKTTNPFGK